MRKLAIGEGEKSDLAYRVGEKMLSIALGELPLGDLTLGELPLSVESALYSFCTDKDLFTGAKVFKGTEEEIKTTFIFTIITETRKNEKAEKLLMEFIGSKHMMIVLEQIKERAMKKPVPKAFVTDSSVDSMDSTGS